MRRYGGWASREAIEDYSLRYAPVSYRRWSPYAVAVTALGSIAYLADFAIGGSIAVTYGMTNAVAAICAAALVIFLTGIPIAVYSARYAIDMDLLTRGAGFGYLGSTLTSLIYASFTFIFFALEGSIMAQALAAGLGVPLQLGYLVCALVVIPVVVYGMTALSRLQLWTQPVWLALMVIPFVTRPPGEWHGSGGVGGGDGSGDGGGFTLVGFGLGAGVALSLIAQIGEQADYLRFMPERRAGRGRIGWWAAVLAAGPGWVVLGALKQLGGALLAVEIVDRVGPERAVQPMEQYRAGIGVTALAVFFVVLSQIKINVTNAYSGSLSWANFFARTLHRHPGRVVWIFFNVGIALALMELGVFGLLNTVLGFYSNVAIAWIGAVSADLAINKPLGLSPRGVEFKRAYLHTINPVGFGSMVIASAVSLAAYFGAFGELAHAFSPFIALGLAIALAPLLALATRGRYYLARERDLPPGALLTCVVCGQAYERPDVADCPFHHGVICSLCCSLEASCHDLCKTQDAP
ncbi:purine-cytosine permease family protein [Actinomadura barringtoniae]|uniref:purine-cytosine permease family protein n=1 Tax=Actinomadura barringtoniae TaxID=1427535 RepID=UPI001FB81A90|nr:hypothetical protein [Actinomadura barringtoniae]